MKVKLNIRNYLEANAGNGINVQAHVSPVAILEALDLPDEDEIDIDIHERLAEERLIAVIWSIEDVQQVRPDLTDDQAWQVLVEVDRRNDAELGINWQTLEDAAELLFGEAPESDEA